MARKRYSDEDCLRILRQVELDHLVGSGHLLQSGLEASPELPGVPLALDLAKTPQTRAALELLLTPNKIGRPFAAPPGVPADRIALLRNAFMLTMKDSALIAEAKSQNLDISPTDGAYIQDTARRLGSLPEEVIKIARDAIKLN